MKLKPSYYPLFDYLRISLAFIVMLGHDGVLKWPNSGNLAVQIFFALSGWLIGTILLGLSTKDLPRFYFNRAVRIWIPYYLALVALVGASLLHDPLNLKWLEFVFYKLSFVYNLFGPSQLDLYKQLMPLQGTGNHFWTVNAEEQFYLLAPLLLVLASAKLGRQVWIWICIALAAWIFDIYASIVLGVLAAVIVKRYGALQLSLPIRFALLAGAFGTAAGIWQGFHYSFLAPIFAICVVLLLATPGECRPFGKFMGGISYPLYLNHWIGVFVGNAILKPFGMGDSPTRQMFSIIINLMIAAMLYWWVDRRILAMRSSLFSQDRGKGLMYASFGMVLLGIAVGLGIQMTVP